MRAMLVAAALAATLAIAPAAIAAPSATAQPGQSAKLRNAMTVEQMREHLTALQGIADLNGGTRAAGTPGYEASVQYVAGKLRDAGYDADDPAVRLPVLPGARADDDGADRSHGDDVRRRDRLPASWTSRAPVTSPRPSRSSTPTSAEPGAVDVRAARRRTSPASPPGNIALIQRGTCTFGAKAQNAVAAGAVGRRDLQPGQHRGAQRRGRRHARRPRRRRPGRRHLLCPRAGVRHDAGHHAAHHDRARSTRSARRPTCSPTRRPATTARSWSSGSHLDSVIAGPGINDNGSGSGVQPRARRADRGPEHQAAQHDPVRVLGRRGGRPPRAPTHYVDEPVGRSEGARSP